MTESSRLIEEAIKNLESIPQIKLGKILVTGATGYIGGRLTPLLINRGYDVRVMVRKQSPEQTDRWPEAEIVEADAIDFSRLCKALEGIHTAYYLIHSLLLGKEAFEEFDIKVACNFRQAAKKMGVKRIIYLTGLGMENEEGLSPHLANRLKVARELMKGDVPVTSLRAAIIIGPGSASFDIIKYLVIHSPVFFIPWWAKTQCQPIAIEDVIKYLVGVLEKPEYENKLYDIGGSTILTYEEMLKIFADIMGKRRFFFGSIITSPSVYGYFASLMTPVPAPITLCLMEGAKNEVICQNSNIKTLVDFEPLSYRTALLHAMTREEKDNIYTRWSDAFPPAHKLAMKLSEFNPPPRFIKEYSFRTVKPVKSLFRAFCKIGGEEGWYNSNWMWRLLAFIDRMFMGFGAAHGRRSTKELRLNDVIDFWRVENIETDKKLLLRAELKLAVKAWLEFRIDPSGEENILVLKVYFQPRRFPGYLFWYCFIPYHSLVFRILVRRIARIA